MNKELFNLVAKDLQGRNGLRTVRPSNGVSAYLWRMVRFHGGIDTSMPITCFFHLQNYLDKTFGKDKFDVCGIIDEKSKALLDDLNMLIDPLCEHFGLSANAAAYAWKGLMY